MGTAIATTSLSRTISILSERQLVDTIVDLLPERLGLAPKSFVVGREISAGRTIADVVLLINPRFRSPSDGYYLNVTESVVVSRLRRLGPTRIDLLETKCGFPRNGLRAGALDRLKNRGILIVEPGGRVRMSPKWGGRKVRIIAVEAKLVRWRQALAQAVGYKRYADHSYVAIPKQFAAAALQSKKLFRSFGIGLIVSQEDGLRVEVRPRASREHDWQRDFVYSRLVIKSAATDGESVAESAR